MRVLVIGQGGREHALVRALSLSVSVTDVHCIPGSDGISREAICHKIDLKDHEKVASFVRANSIDLVVFGPEQPLADGLSDFLRAKGIRVFGPSKMAAQFETSKSYCKAFLERHEIPTAKSFVVHSVQDTSRCSEAFQPPYVLKADGLAAGKGVVIAETREELLEAARQFFEQKSLGTSGEKAVLEEFLEGWELSYLILTNGSEYRPLPLAQDHKRLQDKDKGPNTGGMGAIAPLTIEPQLESQIRERILNRIMQGFVKDGVDYRGVLYVGVMVTSKGPQVLEFNVRFGDPEAQVLLPLLDGDWAQVFAEIAEGRVPELRWKKNIHTACVVMAAEGYPENPIKGAHIKGNPMKQTASSYLLHAGTMLGTDGHWQTNGGRVLNAIGFGSNLQEALKQAYTILEFGKWDGMQFRRDIGAKAKS